MEVQIFAEGNDIKFVQDYITSLNLPANPIHIVKTEGWTKLPLVVSKFKEATNKGVKNLVFFDANGNYAQRKAQILAQKAALSIDFELFLFPDDASSGMVEDLIIQTIPNAQQPIITCFNNYCAAVHAINPNIIFSLKSKFFAYIEATGQPLNMKKIDFKNQAYWDLTHAALNPLKNFLEAQIT
jgi:hypothetical protein